MKPMILGNNDPYDNEFKKEEDHNSKEMEKSVKVQKTKMRLNLVAKQTMIMEVDINEFSMDQLLVKGNWMITMAQIGAPFLVIGLIAVITYFKLWKYLYKEWFTSVDHKKSV